MDWFTGKQPPEQTPKQLLRENQRVLAKSIRNIDRHILNVETQENKQIIEIKRMAQKHEPEVVKTMALNLIRSRNHKKKLMKVKANLQGVSHHIATLDSQQTMANAMQDATRALRAINKQMNMSQIQTILQDFEKQNEIMGIKDEMINETLDDVIGNENENEESDAIVSQVLDELGLQLGPLPEVPTTSKNAQQNIRDANTRSSADDEIMSRLEKLRTE